ncbi:unnamed protein product [Ceutorhynchus assimilis]|uniref:Uncharacterized protein n=1 Tax=Ceutorhynchus assimilis TaxID=467358 RepID=A0A9N9MMT7_9CUCU|nr:unnamed protein product [Ceutorhynchus assimilis]
MDLKALLEMWKISHLLTKFERSSAIQKKKLNSEGEEVIDIGQQSVFSTIHIDIDSPESPSTGPSTLDFENIPDVDPSYWRCEGSV